MGSRVQGLRCRLGAALSDRDTYRLNRHLSAYRGVRGLGRGVGVQDLAGGVWNLGFGVWGLVARVVGVGCGVQGKGVGACMATRHFPPAEAMLRVLLGPLGFNFAQHSPTTRPSVERTAEKAFLLPDRVCGGRTLGFGE